MITPTQALIQKYAVSLVRSLDAIDYLEVGVQEAHTFRVVLETPGVRFAVGIDTWGHEYGGTGRGNPASAIHYIGDLMHKAVLITGDSHQLLPGLRHTFQLIFVDADHSEEGGLMDLADSLPLMADNGVMLFDDIYHPKHPYLRDVAIDFAHHRNLKMHEEHVGHGVAVFRK